MWLRLITKAYEVLCISFSGLPWEEANESSSLIKHSGFTINVETKTKMFIFIHDWEVMLWFPNQLPHDHK